MFALCRPKHQGFTPRGTPGKLIWAQSDPPPVDLSVGDIRSQIAAEWLQISQRSQWKAYRKPPSLFRIVPSLTPYDLPFPQNGGSICPQDTGASTPYKRSRLLRGKSKGEGVCSVFQEIEGEAKISLLIVALISSANYHLIYCNFASG